MISKISQIRQKGPITGFSVGLLLTCILVIPIPTLGFELPKLFALSLTALITAVALLRTKSKWLTALLGSMQGRLFLLFGATLLLSLFWSIAPHMSLLGAAPRFQGVLMHICALTLGLFAMEWVQREGGKRLLAAALLTSNVVVVSYGLLQMGNLDPLAFLFQTEAFLGRVYSFIGHPNTLGQFILLTVPFVILEWWRASSQKAKWFCATLCIGNVLLLLGTVSRSALLGALAMLLLIAPTVRAWIKQQVRKVNKGQALVLSLVAILCITIGLLSFAKRFEFSLEEGRSISARQVIWGATLDMVRDRPQGYGLETMAIVSPQYTGRDLYQFESLVTTVDRAHNEVLHILYALGPLGFITYVSLMVILALSALRYASEDKTGFLRASVLGIVGFQVAVFFGFPSITTATLFWMLTGMALGLLPRKSITLPAWVTPLANVLLVAFALTTFIVSVYWIQSRLYHAAARSVSSERPLETLQLHLEGVMRFKHDRSMLIDSAEAYLHVLEGSPPDRAVIAGNAETLISLLQNVTSNRDGMAYLLEAWLHAVEDDASSAKEDLLRAKQLLPTSFTYHRTAAHIAELVGDTEAVSMEHEAIADLLPDAFFEEQSHMRRILLKQHPWLTGMGL